MSDSSRNSALALICVACLTAGLFTFGIFAVGSRMSVQDASDPSSTIQQQDIKDN